MGLAGLVANPAVRAMTVRKIRDGGFVVFDETSQRNYGEGAVYAATTLKEALDYIKKHIEQ